MTNEPNWSLLRNTFDNVTKNNMKRAFLISRDHRDKLKGLATATPALAPLYQRLNTDFVAFEQQYQTVNSNFGLYQGQTMQVENALSELSGSLIRKWDVMVQVEYDQNSPDYKMILPDGRRLFQSGAYDIRLAAVGTLLSNLTANGNPIFATLIATIDNWLSNIQDLRTQQQQTESRDQALRQDLEAKRQKMMQTMHSVFFGICAHFSAIDDLVKVESLYELRYLRASTTKAADTITTLKNSVSLVPGELKVLLKGSFSENDLFELKNDSSANLMFWLANSDTVPMPSDAFNLTVQQSAASDGMELGDGSSTYTHLLVKNIDDLEMGKADVIYTPAS